ncbi:hypothetical protein ACLOAV_009248 [Pseudogymnoascus australis]
MARPKSLVATAKEDLHARSDKSALRSTVPNSKAFVKQQGGSDLGKTVWLIDYAMAKDIYKSVRTGPWKGTHLDGATLQATVAATISIRNTIFAMPNNPKAAWENHLKDLQDYGIAHGYEEKMEALIQSLGGMVSMDVWDQVWRWFSANPNVDTPQTSIAMTSNLMAFIDTKDSKDAGDQAILVSLADWINEWMEHVLKK